MNKAIKDLMDAKLFYGIELLNRLSQLHYDTGYSTKTITVNKGILDDSIENLIEELGKEVEAQEILFKYKKQYNLL